MDQMFFGRVGWEMLVLDFFPIFITFDPQFLTSSTREKFRRLQIMEILKFRRK
jgi:hypothetical protein